VLQDAVVRCRRPAGVVLRLQAVDRHDHVHARDRRPLSGNLADGARDQLDVDAALREQREQLVQLAVADERLAPDDRQ
jgi:hypothetical protein